MDSMRKIARAGRWADLLHKGFVTACVGLTCYGLMIVSARTYAYFMYVKPQRLAELRLAEKAAAAAEASEETDSAPTLKY